MKIIVFGLPCTKTQRTLINVEAAVGELDHHAKIYQISDIHKMREWGVVYTPTVMVNDKEKSSGRIPSVHEILTWIEEERKKKVAVGK
jgi:small redox-active disulfide protein 2